MVDPRRATAIVELGGGSEADRESRRRLERRWGAAARERRQDSRGREGLGQRAGGEGTGLLYSKTRTFAKRQAV